MKLPSLNQKLGPFQLWQWALGGGILVFLKENHILKLWTPHWGVGAIGGGGVQGIGGAIGGGGIGGYGDDGYGYFCSLDDGYCGGGGGGGDQGGGPGGGGGGGKHKHGGGQHGGGGGGPGGWY